MWRQRKGQGSKDNVILFFFFFYILYMSSPCNRIDTMIVLGLEFRKLKKKKLERPLHHQ